ncbi:protein stoned-B [Ischnura elegans]|uniref:protein stoned-B n=1 Tax=Ischnura elegans TaxID=197161 RepID=UPI001ED88CE6|nr:protein stoned-B [Ischnura elegans]
MAGANPFLSDFASDYGNAAEADVAVSQMGVNPFLSDGGDFGMGEGAGENPFLSGGGDEDPGAFLGGGTNPFASDFGGDEGDLLATGAEQEATNAAYQDIFGSGAPEEEELPPHPVAAPERPPAPPHPAPPHPAPPHPTPPHPAPPHQGPPHPPPPRPPPAHHPPPARPPVPEHHDPFHQQPEADLLGADDDDEATSAETSQIMSSGPGRPPPPRPAPPSRETQALILSVTGAMEATSSHLLDRLRATKTPSPTPIRDLHSPSPDPSPFLLTDDEPREEDGDLLGEVCEPAQVSMPQAESAQAESMQDSSAQGDADFLDIFGGGGEAPPKPAPASKTNADLMALFEAPPPPPPVEVSAPEEEQPQPSLLQETAPPVVTHQEVSADFLMGDFGEVSGGQPGPPPPTPAAGVTAPENVDFLSESPNVEAPITAVTAVPVAAEVGGGESDFDAFAAKFESAAKEEEGEGGGGAGDPFDPFAAGAGGTAGGAADDAWGSSGVGDGGAATGFGGEEDQFDAFLSMKEAPAPAPPPPMRMTRAESADSDDGGPDFSIFIRPKAQGEDGAVSTGNEFEPAPVLAPPPRSPEVPASRFNPFDKSGGLLAGVPAPDADVSPAIDATTPPTGTPWGEVLPPAGGEPGLQRSESQETPPTPLFDEDVSQPLEDFPRTIHDETTGWEMQLRQPNKKKITGQRFWKKVFVKLVTQGDNPVLQLYNTKDDKDPFQELPLQPCYSVSDISAQQYDAYGKIFTVKLQYVFYKERPGVRPGQVTKAERITNKLSQFAAYAIQGDYQGVKEFGSDLKKLGLPVEHAPQISQLLKLGSMCYEDLKVFSMVVEEALFKLSAHRDRALNYKTDEVQITAVDELYVEQNNESHVTRQIARVRVFFLGFLAGMPDIELGVNDMVRQGKEVVGRHDIIPVVTEEWIRLENVEFHSCVETTEYETTRSIKFKPPDACYIELMRFRVRPPKNRELPLQLKVTTCTTGNKIEIKGDILVPGFASRKLGQVPCEDVAVRFPIPECWIYLFRVEKHFRYGSVKSAHRRTGKIKGIERLLGAVETPETSLIEVTSGQAKYEHQHRAIVWRMSRLPKEGQGAYTTHQFVCRLALTSYDQMPEKLDPYVYVEFTMPATQVSHTTIRSVSVSGGDNDPPEKYVRYLARHEYRVEVEHTQGTGPGAYVTATLTAPKAPEPVAEEEKPDDVSAKDSDSDSSS